MRLAAELGNAALPILGTAPPAWAAPRALPLIRVAIEACCRG